MSTDPLRCWHLTGLISAALIVVLIPAAAIKERLRATPPAGPAAPAFVGRERCVHCHRLAFERWQGSHHDRSMAEADDSTVLGDFNDVVFDDGVVCVRFFRNGDSYLVTTAGPDGEPADFEISYVLGVEPLQQYLVCIPDGRVQCLTVAWDTSRGEWFNLYPGQEIPPDDWLYWTRGGQNWNGMCAECHSTNLRKAYDHESKTFATTWSEIDVSCEACHGPGSGHVEWAEIPPMARPLTEDYGLVIRTGGISAREEVELCAPCHSRRTVLGDYNHTSNALMESLVPALLEPHLYEPDGQIKGEVYVYGSFVQSKMFRREVRCSDCHDVHSLERHQPGTPPGGRRVGVEGAAGPGGGWSDNQLCLQCHRGDAYDSTEHHFHRKTVDGRASDGTLCVKCHMPKRPYMVVDWRADHSIRIPRPDLSAALGVPNACSQAGCHDDKPLVWVTNSFEQWYGRAAKPHYGTILAAGRNADPDARSQLQRLAGNTLYPAIVRATALPLLRSYPGEDSAQVFIRALADEEPLVRYTGVLTAEAGSAEQLVELLAPLLFDPVTTVRLQAASRLAGVPEELLEPYQREALDQGVGDFEQAMQYSLDFAFAGHNLGNLYTSLGQPARAEAAYRAAIEVDELFAPAKVNLATLLNAGGRNDEAEALLRSVLEAYPEMHEVRYSLGLLLAELQRFDEAAQQLGAAATGMPNRPRILYNLGLVLQRLHRTAEATAALQQAVNLDPDNPDYRYALATLPPDQRRRPRGPRERVTPGTRSR